MTEFKTFMSSYNENSLKQFILDYEKLEEDGFIGDSALREAVNAWEDIIGSKSTHVTLWMTSVALYAYKHFTHKYFADDA